MNLVSYEKRVRLLFNFHMMEHLKQKAINWFGWSEACRINKNMFHAANTIRGCWAHLYLGTIFHTQIMNKT